MTITLHIAPYLSDKLYCWMVYAECWQTTGTGLTKCVKSFYRISGQSLIHSAFFALKHFLWNINYLNIILYTT